MKIRLTRKERLLRQTLGQEVDQIPCLGGWIGGVRNLAWLGGIPTEEYLRNPIQGTIRAHLAIGVDGLIQPIFPNRLEQIRSGHVREADFMGIEPEEILHHAEEIPETEKEILASFNYQAEENYYRNYFMSAFQNWGGIEPVPNFWEIGGHFPLYTEFGYTAFWIACAQYPEAVGKIWWARSLHSRERAKILLKLYREFDLIPLMFCGEDLCNNNGPMVSPAMLRKYYLPSVKMIIEPLVDSGIRLIHHCDGDIRIFLQDFLDIGFSGFQGFQYELGIDLYDLMKLRCTFGELLLFTGLSVSRTLPFGSLSDIQEEVDYFIDATDGGRGMFLFTSNVTGVEVPPENIKEAYSYVKQWDPTSPRIATRSQWREVKYNL
jgi:hypothetical protein